MERRVAIIGAGTSGLVACKYLVEFGFNPIVFEVDDGVGGLWRHTMESTKLQNHKSMYQFVDFPWPSSVKEDNPSHKQVVDYLNSYAEHFSLISYIRFNSKVIDIDYVGESSEEMETWALWGGNGRPFSSKGTWHISVQDTKNLTIEVHKAEFVILCIGKYSGFPNIPEFPAGQGPEVFNGRVMHSMDYSNLDNDTAAELIKGKRITIIGSQKSALDLAAECANANGVTNPCTIIQRTVHWFLPDFNIWGVLAGFLYMNRFAELTVHKPGEPFLLGLLATLLSPLVIINDNRGALATFSRWGITKLVETALKWKQPLKKYGFVPNHSFFQDLSTCLIGVYPDNFFDKLKEGSILVKKSQSFSFFREGVIIDGEAKPLETDLVFFATGYKGDQKIKNLFKSPIFQNYIIGPATSTVPLYRQIIHPRIPQLAMIGYAESLSNIFASEMKSLWVVHFLDGNVELPSIREMEKDVKLWEDHLKQYGGRFYWKSCIASCGIWYHDQLCKDMKHNPRRKKGFIAELFAPYGHADYVGLTRTQMRILKDN